jgi:lauroyl/myristoyl acyltransferase
MSKLDQEASARLLEILLIFSAGLQRKWPRRKIVAAYGRLGSSYERYRSIDTELLHSPDPVTIDDIDRLESTLGKFSPSEVVIATAHHGHFVAFFCACARRGIPLAACYQNAREAYLDAAVHSGLLVIELGSVASPHELVARLDAARAAGRYVALMIDGPVMSRKRYDFLGYKVAASALASVYARRAGCALLPLFPRIASAGSLSFLTRPVIDGIDRDQTQELLHLLEATIVQECEQYQWISNSVLLSDPTARDNSLSFLDEALAWRDSRH